ncbi:MAG: hydrogenase iron-sulfur subunit [Deltaproteobacteria bacterium]|nr:hydrogenase iron-sulfur subunit [Deltaproteobacteria bacterium]
MISVRTRFLKGFFSLLDRLATRLLSATWNPLAHTGSLSFLSFLVSVVTGVLLLFWYVPSASSAHGSLEAMRNGMGLAQLVRSLHRYGSDACMLFVLLHALRHFASRRIGGARWIAWVSGVFLLGLTWFTGWIGYWLVWDEQGRRVAVGTAKVLDALPVFADPLSRSFLADASLNPLLFFLVFLAHLLIPLLCAMALWFHVMRVHRPRLVPGRPLVLALMGLLIACSLAIPALSAAPARMMAAPSQFPMDAWYVLPAWLTDRLGAGWLWGGMVIVGTMLVGAPLVFRRAALPSAVDVSLCNGCGLCQRDCPYVAIQMVPRTDGRHFSVQAQVDPARCASCGACTGACDPGAIGLPDLAPLVERKRIDAWLDRAVKEGERPFVAFLCSGSAGAQLDVDSESGLCKDLPGYRVRKVPCAAWVHMLTVERALRHGAQGVLISGCGGGGCEFREGLYLARLRLSGDREPGLRSERVDRARVHLVMAGRTERRRLIRAAQRIRDGERQASARIPTARLIGGSLVMATAIGGIVLVGSRVPYGPPRRDPDLVVSFKHAGRADGRCRDRTPEELLAMAPHMRTPKACERGRAPVRLRVHVDGHVRVEKSYPPHGLFGDGASVAIEQLPVTKGVHDVRVEIGETKDPKEWSYRDERRLEFQVDKHVVLFDKAAGVRWY